MILLVLEDDALVAIKKRQTSETEVQKYAFKLCS